MVNEIQSTMPDIMTEYISVKCTKEVLKDNLKLVWGNIKEEITKCLLFFNFPYN